MTLQEAAQKTGIKIATDTTYTDKGKTEEKSCTFEYPSFAHLPPSAESVDVICNFLGLVSGKSEKSAIYGELIKQLTAKIKTNYMNSARQSLLEPVASEKKVNSELADLFSDFSDQDEETQMFLRKLAERKGKNLDDLVSAKLGK